MHTACGCAGEAREIFCGSHNSTSPFRFTPGSGIPWGPLGRALGKKGKVQAPKELVAEPGVPESPVLALPAEPIDVARLLLARLVLPVLTLLALKH